MKLSLKNPIIVVLFLSVYAFAVTSSSATANSDMGLFRLDYDTLNKIL